MNSVSQLFAELEQEAKEDPSRSQSISPSVSESRGTTTTISPIRV